MGRFEQAAELLGVRSRASGFSDPLRLLTSCAGLGLTALLCSEAGLPLLRILHVRVLGDELLRGLPAEPFPVEAA